MLVRPSSVRLGTVTAWTVLHGPSGAGATSIRTVEPFQSSALTAEIHSPSSNLGCIGLLAPLRSVLIGTAAARLATQSIPFQYFGCRSNRLAGTRATNICEGGGDVGSGRLN